MGIWPVFEGICAFGRCIGHRIGASWAEMAGAAARPIATRGRSYSRMSCAPEGGQLANIRGAAQNTINCRSGLASRWAAQQPQRSKGLYADQWSSPSSSSPPATFIPSSLILRVRVLRPQPSSSAASRRRPAVCLSAVSIMIRSKLGTALSSRFDWPRVSAWSAHWRSACSQLVTGAASCGRFSSSGGRSPIRPRGWRPSR